MGSRLDDMWKNWKSRSIFRFKNQAFLYITATYAPYFPRDW